MRWIGPAIAAVTLWSLVAVESDHHYADSCAPGTRSRLENAYCRRIHDCRSSFALSDEEFEDRYGTDRFACEDSQQPFVETVSTNAPQGSSDLLQYCVFAVESASCEEIASDALLMNGRACDPAVLSGEIEPREIPSCGGSDPGCLRD